ncbi:aspartate-semialdehyde dehydrogenase [Salinisphaera sp.]|uniref:aspartate-semialdehyde dehydrogenase n=1 Tax=Salinisphaera sp. TaxID=1914330 RepID=UPI000C6A7B7A|nr:aspartate-semialdehyde dehydrogenase [Salinisphaera sp.]MBS62837.1 aspartate-semialdehyde dehydrogenase [Salinisphaera sp.]
MTKTYDVAVVGATGTVGEVMLEILEEREFPVGRIFALASKRSAGKRARFRDKSVSVANVADFDFSRVQLALFAAGDAVSRQFAPAAAAAGCVVVDSSAHFRDAEDVPLIVPEVNPQALAGYCRRGIVASPGGPSIQMAMALKPIHEVAEVRRVNVTTYQAVSGSGATGLRELADQSARLLNAQAIKTPAVYTKQIAFNVLAQIDTLEDNGYTREEMALVGETRRILDAPGMQINPTAVQVPVFFGHSEAIHLETRDKLSAVQACRLLADAPGLTVVDTPEAGGYASAVTDAANQDEVFVSRIREDISCENGLNFWVVADNVRRGAALNSVQIAERLIEEYI